ncbi:MAG: metal-dependent transcriptional regulator [Candidatus Methanofastidiosia archaeon]
MGLTAEEYLKTLWILEEGGNKISRIKDISKKLDIKPPSAVEMLKKLEKDGMIKYRKQKGISLTAKGRKTGENIIRYHRLMEVLLFDVICIENEDVEKLSCGAEHFFTSEIANKICAFLDHPKICPHGKKIPSGECCIGKENENFIK